MGVTPPPMNEPNDPYAAANESSTAPRDQAGSALGPQFAMELAEKCYQTTRIFPKEELFGLTSQIRRAASSIPSNIAEGQGRDHTKEFLNHLSIARGSLMELETHLILSQRVGLLEQAELESLLALSDRTSRMLSGLRKALGKRLET
jgi:four helix bundle protein